jgi:8-oxo-dGTP pyrophosphatase MutT (NUDIX family)
MKHSSGILLTTGRHWLLAERSRFVDNPLVWGVPGGGVPRDARGRPLPNLPSACREFWEEMGAVVPPESYVVGRTMRDGRSRRKGRRKRWTTWVLQVPESARAMRFVPNYETGEYGWVRPGDAQRLPLHPGLLDTLGDLRKLAVFGRRRSLRC